MNRERLILQRRIRTKQQLLWDVVFLAMLVIVGSFGAIAIAIITIPFLVQMSGLLYYRWSTARTLRRVSKGSLAQLDGCFMPYRRDDLVPWLHGRW